MTIDRVPSSFAAFSELVSVRGPGAWIHVAGQVGFNDARDGVVEGGVRAQSQTIFDQIDALLAGVGGSLADMVKINVFMTDLSEYGEFSAVRAERFPHNPPASAAVGVADLLLGASIEIDGVAFVPER